MYDKSQLMRGTLEGCILKILSQNTSYGYEIVTTLLGYGFKDIKEGTIPKIKAGIRKQIPNPHNVKANPGSIYMPLLSSFCMTLIQYIISGRNSTDSSLGIDKHCLKDSLAFRHLYRSGVFRG